MNPVSSVAAPVNITNLTAPTSCLADFSLVPIGDGSTSFSQQIAAIQRLCRQSGLKYVMHATGTTIEGPWDQVHQVIGWAHSLLHQQGTARIQTDVRVSTRTDKVQLMEAEITTVERILAA
ncbi:YkoF-like protein [Talaromyces proteolyticus]|uniref:YkoF-like protein n=1 Tax=Talaromyces proteolyticus TaxID=1131652 RepID=A0AAD4KFZ2_9EURO|nr:YkoF-like protein [Talaromyces proteolyticus]KAH8689471.1 YkoF-like protein [Talaromyces proteolyticus]